MNIAGILIISFLVELSCVYSDYERTKKNEMLTYGNNTWDHFVFTQQWPISVCIDANITHQHTCSLPRNVTTWTVHGLWPSLHSSHNPNYCNNSAKFDPEALEPIMDLLQKYWPNLYTDSKVTDFWNHEWTKHGTCAASLPGLKREVDYFNQTLHLNRQFDFLGLFEQQGLIPRDGYTYQLFEIEKAVTAALGFPAQIQCTIDIAEKVQYLMQIEMCIDKSYNSIKCPLSVKTADVSRSGVMLMESGDQSYKQYNIHTPTTCTDTIPIAYLPIPST